jgi:predicted ATPase
LRSEVNFEGLDINEAPFLLDNKVYRLTILDDNINQPLDFEAMSDGVKRVFLILLSVIFSDINNNSLIAIEEPENSVHPGLLQQYIQLITSLSEELQDSHN